MLLSLELTTAYPRTGGELTYVSVPSKSPLCSLALIDHSFTQFPEAEACH